MTIFEQLRALRAAQKTLLPFLQTSVDLDILLEIGHAEESGRPLGITDLFHAEFAPPATISRRLLRLKNLGVVTQRRLRDNHRRSELRLKRAVSKNCAQILRLFAHGQA